MDVETILKNATSKSYKPSKIDAVPMDHLHTTLGHSHNDEYTFLLKCYNLQNQGSANKTSPISKDDFHHQVKNILIRGIDDRDLTLFESCVGVVIRSPKNLEFFTFDDIPQKSTFDIYHISLFSNNGVDSFPNIYLGKIDSNSMDVIKSSMDLYGMSDIESKIIQFERNKLDEYKESEKNEFDMQSFLKSFYTDDKITIPKSEYDALKRNQKRGGRYA